MIVESKNDQFFFEALIKHINLKIEVGSPICSIDDYDCLGGIGKLELKLKAIKGDIQKGKIDKVGIIFDADQVGINQRKKLILEKIQQIFTKEEQPIFSLYILNIEGEGELETVLKKIHNQNSEIADCLISWQACLPKNKQVKIKDFDKLWIQFYQRFDCCNKKEQKQAGRKCGNEKSFSKNIYNYDHPQLNKLKQFLHDLGC